MTIPLTSSEVASLWMQFITDSLDVCIKKHVLATVKDNDIRSIYNQAMRSSENHLEKIRFFFEAEQYPIPIGFTDEDVDTSAPPLYDDVFWLHYLYTMSIYGMDGYSLAIAAATRGDILQYYQECIKDSLNFLNQSLHLMLEKGIFVRPASLHPSDSAEYIKKQHFLAGWVGEKRPLNAIEMSNLTVNLQKSSLSKALVMGFSQVSKNQKVKDYFGRLIKVADSHCQLFYSVLSESDIPSPPSMEDKIIPSNQSPFSDKLKMFHTCQLINAAIAYYGTALSVSMRRDLGAHYTASIAKLLILAEDGMNLMIDHEWMEQPPQAVNRK
ncbi:DUF3231 family protein [Heyndrickxia acidicola]|uniref:DUF3231 family protein n=1 Tax=Heyndrickxia acidicola TaxID=209389 RepID=A0ABU6MGI4_9BACI|nr:DUF3231 family protein [Heyndrickxia acidicola]MED1203523.1 DUF3231 family protein [Heyndrickxia acidicola]